MVETLILEDMGFKGKKRKLLPGAVQTIQSPAATAVFASKKASHTNCIRRGTGLAADNNSEQRPKK